jgi:protein-disulfide isomerase
MHPRRLVPWIAIGCLLAFASSGLGAQPQPEPQKKRPGTSLQAQIDSLREGQEKLQKELEGLKALLEERATRVDAPVAARPQETMTLNVFGEPFKGSAGARVAILEYSDFDCSFCAKYATEIFPLIDHAYIQSGQVKYFFRDLPGPEHLNALFKARVARCAGEQDQFWGAHDRLFKNQSPFDGPGLIAFGEALGLDRERFNACITSDRYQEAIQRSATGASRMRIHGTPAFLIGTLSEDGTVLRAVKVFLGAESFQAFQSVLDGLLKPTQPPASERAS